MLFSRRTGDETRHPDTSIKYSSLATSQQIHQLELCYITLYEFSLTLLFVFHWGHALVKVHCWHFQLEYEDSGSDFCDEDCLGKSAPLKIKDYGAAGDRLDLREIFFTNEEYYSKLEELKKAHLCTMAELDRMYRRKLQLKSLEPLDMTALDVGHRWVAFSQDNVRDSVLIMLGILCLNVCLTVIVWP